MLRPRRTLHAGYHRVVVSLDVLRVRASAKLLRRTLWTALVVPVSLGAQVAGPQSAVRDSSGVRIVTYASLVAAPVAFELSEPIVRIGGLRENENEELNARHPFLAAALLSGGRIVVTDWASLNFYSANGKFESKVGRAGSGPGEFSQIRKVCRLAGDTLLAIDYSDSRLSLWTATGELVRARSRVGFAASTPCFSDGSLLVLRPPDRAIASVPTYLGGPAAHFARVRLDGTLVADLGWLPMGMPGPVNRFVTVAASETEVIVADGRSFEVRVYSWTGALLRILRVTSERENLSPSRRSELIGAARLRVEEDSRGPLPAYGPIETDAAGRIWVRGYLAANEWTVFDASLRLLGTLTVPYGIDRQPRVTGIGDGHMWVQVRDEDGAPILELRRFAPRVR
jgi:hypothetical protein